jgi:hypothetical protein
VAGALYVWLPLCHESSFWIWILVLYLATLAIEMLLVVAIKPDSKRTPQTDPSGVSMVK